MKEIIKSIIATILYLVLIELVTSWTFIAENLGIENYNRFYLLIQGFLQLLLIASFILIRNRNEVQKLWNKTSIKWYIIGMLLGSLFVVFQSLLNLCYNFLLETNYIIKYDFDGISEFGTLNILSRILFIPIAEELFFRSYLQEELQEKIKPWLSILVVSILFSSIHGPYLVFEEFELNYNFNWHLVYITFFGGLISGVLYLKSKSIGPSIIFHVFWNLIVTIV